MPSRSVPLWQGAELNTYFDVQCRKREVREHRKRLRRIKSGIDNRPPKKLNHLSSSATRQTFTNFEYKRIDDENSKLLERLHDLSKEPSKYKRHEKVGSKNVGDMLRRREQERISRENEILARRIRSSQPTYRKEKWDRDFRNHRKVMDERMKRHLVRHHGPRYAKKLEERKYLGKHRAFSDLGSEASFDTMSTMSMSGTESVASAQTFTTESSVRVASSVCSEARTEKLEREPDDREGSRDSAGHSRHETADFEIQETCFGLEQLDAFINPNIPEITMRPVTKMEKDEPDEVSDWEDDSEWQEQEIISKKSGKQHKVIKLKGQNI